MGHGVVPVAVAGLVGVVCRRPVVPEHANHLSSSVVVSVSVGNDETGNGVALVGDSTRRENAHHQRRGTATLPRIGKTIHDPRVINGVRLTRY
jgi:hypothetical protein